MSYFKDGELVRQDYDTDGDGKPDLKSFYRNKVLVRVEQDPDEDGRPNVTQYLKGGKIVREERDANGDGTTDLLLEYKDEKVVKKSEDTDFDGRPNAISYYKGGTLVLLEEDTNGDGRVDVVSHYERKQLVRQEVDTDHDGKTDTIEHSGAAGKRVGSLAETIQRHAPKAVLPKVLQVEASPVPSQEWQASQVKEEITVPLDSNDPRFREYLELVKLQILEYWHYPTDAKPGLKGNSAIEFSIERNGTVSRVDVIKSSGNPVLDRGAMESLRRASPFPPLPTKFKTNRLKIVGGFRYN